MSELKLKAEKKVTDYIKEHGMDDIGPTGIAERFINTYQQEYQIAGDEFLHQYLEHKFVEGYL